MAKTRTTYFCQNCGAQSGKWIGKCPSCNEWNTYVEEVVSKGDDAKTPGIASTSTQRASKPLLISEINLSEQHRIPVYDKELSRVLGGGLVPGSLILFGGEPGIGKSTLMLQVALNMKNLKVLYVSGEESEQQIRMRAERIGMNNPNCYILTETSTQNIFKQIEILEPNFLIVDSIQTLYSAHIESSPGSVSQIRECTSELMRYAKESGTAVFLIGHITKDGSLAGPKVLEHMVDTVLQFEGDRHYAYRILRTLKNRFGSTSELGIYEMTGEGMRVVSNPSEILITQREEQLSGSAIAASLEGMRPLLIEVQALVTQSVYGTPQRTVSGFDLRRLQLLLAVLEKRGGFLFGTKDVFVNIAGGLKVEDPSIDLAIICALLSSYEDVPLPQHVCFAGEVGLNGEIRAVNRIEQRIAEAEKLGFEKIIVSKYNKKSFDPKSFKIQIVAAGQVHEVYQLLF